MSTSSRILEEVQRTHPKTRKLGNRKPKARDSGVGFQFSSLGFQISVFGFSVFGFRNLGVWSLWQTDGSLLWQRITILEEVHPKTRELGKPKPDAEKPGTRGWWFWDSGFWDSVVRVIRL
jgi:hypothetical protein